jgi:hypothetical protein
VKTSIEINLPISKVVELFIDKNNFKNWKNDFISFEYISGIPGEVGSVTKLINKRGIMFETIISRNMAGEIIETYEHKREEKTILIHRATNSFKTLNENRTLFEVETELVEVNGFLFKLIMTLMAGAGKKYSQIQLNKFKEFAESEIRK